MRQTHSLNLYLSWLKVVVRNVSQLLWYLQRFPPAQTESPSTQSLVSEYQDDVSTPVTKSKDSACPPAEVTIVNKSPPSLFALIIGINKYKDPDVLDLGGAVPDADAVYDFLTSEVGVDKERIVNLRDEKATREAIMEAIRGLAQNSPISAQDAILIYYAGHGGEARPPVADWKTNNVDGMIQMLIPHDFSSKASDDEHRQGIFDITISTLLNEIAQQKSDNITVIFDCCHSASGTRDQADETLLTRGIHLPNYTIPMKFLPSGVRMSSVTSTHEKTGMSSHVLLAACMRGQQARERAGRGAFTSALLSLLRKEGIDQLTYAEIIARLPDLPLQNPQCEGDNRDRILFNSNVSNPRCSLYHICATPKKGLFTLEAGAAHGITKGAEFAVYLDTSMTSLAGTVVACNPGAFTTECSVVGNSPPFSLSGPAHAVQRRIGDGQDLRLFIEISDPSLDLFKRLGEEMLRTDAKKRSFRLVNNVEEQPDLVISVRNGLVKFEVMDQICRQYDLTQMPFDDISIGDSDHLLSILRSAADFYWHLRNSDKINALTTFVAVECFRLVGSKKYAKNFNEILIPDPDGKNLNNAGTIFIDVNKKAEYGFKITNTSKVSLYAALFYFDVSDLSIVKYYVPGIAANGHVDYSLPAGGSLTVGFGDSGTHPPSYHLRDNQRVDVGFLKLYLSTTYVDFMRVCQKSPFAKGMRYSLIDEPKTREMWSTLTIPIVQRAGLSVVER